MHCRGACVRTEIEISWMLSGREMIDIPAFSEPFSTRWQAAADSSDATGGVGRIANPVDPAAAAWSRCFPLVGSSSSSFDAAAEEEDSTGVVVTSAASAGTPTSGSGEDASSAPGTSDASSIAEWSEASDPLATTPCCCSSAPPCSCSSSDDDDAGSSSARGSGKAVTCKQHA